ncbi:glycosyltransferase family 2 protein [Geminocystis sp. CENA526]|uniref:glycosyltransferase family 2 protein n=1 Tax=Geminocystis sp. CENA526 TaxID=1355871 RepID=UPI003D6FEF32
MTKVSVIIPVYNSQTTVLQTLESVLNQTYSDFELIIVDDGSTDRSIELCQESIEQQNKVSPERIKIVHQQNRGLAGARNTGIRHSQGEYLAFVDADDLWLPEKLEYHVQHLDHNPTVGVSFSRSEFIDIEGKALGIYQIPQLTNITPDYLFCRNPISNGSAVVIRRETLEGIKFQENLYGEIEDFYFDDTFRQSEDIECWLRIALQTNWHIEGIPNSLTLYRVNEKGLSANIRSQYEAWERILHKTETYNPEFIKKWGNKARAYQLRYLARRAVRLRSPQVAFKLFFEAIKYHWRIIIEEPRRTIITFFECTLCTVASTTNSLSSS